MWKIKLESAAKRELKRLDEDIRDEAVAVLQDLADWHFPPGSERLRKHERFERLKFYRDQYRIIYRIDKKQKQIVVTRIRLRDKNTYRGLNPTIGYELHSIIF